MFARPEPRRRGRASLYRLELVSDTVTPSAPPDDPSSRGRLTVDRLRAEFEARPVGVAIVLYAIVGIAAAAAAYFAIFSFFAPWDDEGTLLVTVKAFTHGDVLYRDIYTPYGPFYYELFGGLFGATGWSVSTDASRLIVLVVWVATSGLYGLAVQRLTGKLVLGLTGMIVAFSVLGAFVNEPMHAHCLASLLLAGFVLIAVSGPPRRIVVTGLIAGGLVGALLLTKVNLGIFAVAAAAFAAALTVDFLYRRRWLRWAVLVAFLAMPVAIMARDLGQAWVREFLTLEFLGLVAIGVAAWPARPMAGDDDSQLGRWLLAAAAGCVLAVVAILGALLLTGPSLSDTYEGIVGQALRIRDAFVVPFTLPPAAADWGIGAVAVSLAVTWLRPSSPGTPTIWPGLLRIVSGLTIWFTIAHAGPFSVNPAANIDSLPLALAWVAAIPPSGPRESAYRRYLRVLLPALAVAEALQVYPVAGSQVSIAAVLFVPVGALCLADGLRSLRTWAATRGTEPLRRLGVITAIAAVALLGKFALESIVRPGLSNEVIYANQPSLALPGATLMHMPAAQAESYERMVALLKQHRCTTFVGLPSINSLYLWSGLDAPKPQLPGPWMRLLDAHEQQRAVDELRASDRPCAIRNETEAAFWLQGASTPETPLVDYVLSDFKPVAQVGEFQFLLPKRAPSG